MPKYKEGDEKKFFPAVLAALIVIAVAVAAFIFSLVDKEPEDLDEELIIKESADGTILVNPGPGLATPSGPPSLPPPTSPPPGN